MIPVRNPVVRLYFMSVLIKLSVLNRLVRVVIGEEHKEQTGQFRYGFSTGNNIGIFQ